MRTFLELLIFTDFTLLILEAQAGVSSSTTALFRLGLDPPRILETTAPSFWPTAVI